MHCLSQTTPIMQHSSTPALLVLVLLLVAAAVQTAARQLEGDPAEQQERNIQSINTERVSYQAAALNSSCHGFLIGIGTQKGGTTALWAYIADNAHPHLRVSKTKELGFWDNLHGKYSGCRIGDYLQLQTADESAGQEQPRQQELPVCTAVSSIWTQPQQQIGQDRQKPWSTSSTARLRPSKDCMLHKALSPQPMYSSTPSGTAQASSPSAKPVAAAGPAPSTAAAAELSSKQGQHSTGCPQGLYLPGDMLPTKPWWWLWGRWGPAQTGIACLQQDQHTLPGAAHSQPQMQLEGAGAADDSVGTATVLGPARLLLQDYEAAASLDLTTSSSRRIQQAMGQPASAILGAPAQLALQEDLSWPQPMFHADITPRYMFDPAVPPRVRALLPEARIVVILRDPVARAVSNFNMWFQKQAAKGPAERPKVTWSEMLAAQVDGEITRLSACYASVDPGPISQPELSSCLGLSHPYSDTYDADLFANRLLAQGLYAEQLQRWFALFPAESFLIWVSEDFKSDPSTHMQHLVRWLGLDPELLSTKLRGAGSRLKPVHSRHYDGAANEEVVARMRRFLEPHNQRLYEMLEAKGFGAVAARMRQVWPQQ